MLDAISLSLLLNGSLADLTLKLFSLEVAWKCPNQSKSLQIMMCLFIISYIYMYIHAVMLTHLQRSYIRTVKMRALLSNLRNS